MITRLLGAPRRTRSDTTFTPFPEKPLFAVREESARQPAQAAAAPDPLDSFSPYYDASFLFRHMEALGIDRDQLEREDPLLFCELQGRCALCRSKLQCAEELAFTQSLIGRENWEMYCPNARTLGVLGALQNCGRAAQHLRWPRSPE